MHRARLDWVLRGNTTLHTRELIYFFNKMYLSFFKLISNFFEEIKIYLLNNFLIFQKYISKTAIVSRVLQYQENYFFDRAWREFYLD